MLRVSLLSFKGRSVADYFFYFFGFDLVVVAYGITFAALQRGMDLFVEGSFFIGVRMDIFSSKNFI